MLKKIIIILLLLKTVGTQAQGDSLTTLINELFTDSKITWIKHYKARMNDLSDVSITLGSNGKNCRGVMTFLRSGEKFHLSGIFENDTLDIDEYDQKGYITGTIKGLQNGKKINAEWSNYNATIGGIPFKMEEVSAPVSVASFCGDNKWIRNYRGVFGENEVELLLQRASFGEIRGVGYLKGVPGSLTVKGLIDESKLTMDLTLKDLRGEKKGSLTLRQKSVTEFVGNFIQMDEKKRYGDLTRDDNIDMRCVDYADYVVTYDVTYPKISNDSFNLWIQDLVDVWFRQNQAHLNDLRMNNLDNVPEIRNIARAYAWTDVDFSSQDLISGQFVAGNSWSTFNQERAFIYDLYDKRPLFKEDIFTDYDSAREWLRQRIQDQLRNHLLYYDLDFQEFILNQRFDNISIRKEGLAFSSETNLIFGRVCVTIPFQELLPYLRKSGSMWQLAKK